MSKQIVWAAEWLPGRKCIFLQHVSLFIFLLSFTYTCLEGVLWLYSSWWGFVSRRVAYARDVVVFPTWRLLWNPRGRSSLRGRLIRQAPRGTASEWGCLSSDCHYTAVQYTTGTFRLFLHIKHDQTGDIKTHLVTRFGSTRLRLLFYDSCFSKDIVKHQRHPPAIIRVVYFWIMGKLYVT